MPNGDNFVHMPTNATQVISTTACRLGGVAINTKGASSNVLTLYAGGDSGAPVIAVIDTTSAIGTIGYDLNVPGLTAVMGTGTAADVTIMWSAGP